MSKYRYQATDAQGKPVSGEVEATGADDARRKLADQGLDAPSTPSLRRYRNGFPAPDGFPPTRRSR